MRQLALALLVGIPCLSAPAGAHGFATPILPALRAHLVVDAPITHEALRLLPIAVLSTVAAPTAAAVIEATPDSRPFWYAAGAGTLANLAVHTVLGLPALGATVVIATGFSTLSAPVVLALLVGGAGTYFAAAGLVGALVVDLVHNGMNRTSEGSFAAAYAGYLAGAGLALVGTGVVAGLGGTLIGGMFAIAPFTGSAGVSSIGVLSILGAMPAVILIGVAVVALPAVMAAWAVTMTAVARASTAADVVPETSAHLAPATRSPPTTTLVAIPWG